MKFILAAILFLLGSGLASAQELFPLQRISGVQTSGCSADGTAAGRAVIQNYPYIAEGQGIVNWNDCYQVVDGWGADSIWEDSGLTQGGMAGVYTLTNGNGGPGMGFTHSRWECGSSGAVWWGSTAVQCLPTVGSDACTTLTYGSQLGVTYYLSGGLGWSNVALRPFSQFAAQTASWLQNLSTQCSIQNPFYTYTLSNECDIVCSDQDFHDLTAALGSAFATAGINLPIALPENQSFSFGNEVATMTDPTTAALVNVIDWHPYDGDASSPYPWQNQGKHGWMTEIASVWGDQNSWYPQIANQLETFFNNFFWGANLAEFQIGYCGQTAPVDNGACFAYDQGGYVNFLPGAIAFGQLSRYVRPGWHVYGATSNPFAQASNDWGQMLFFRSPNTNDFAIAVANNHDARQLTVNFQGFTATSVTPILNWIPQSPVSAGSGFSYTLPASAIVTFTGTAN